MKYTMTRRRLMQALGGVFAAAAIVSFDTESRAWASHGGPHHDPIPHLDGALLLDAAALAAAGDDFGHIVHESPVAVLVPGSVKDIVEMVKFARKHGLFIAGARGIGESHSAFGQAQVAAGIVVDMSAWNEIHEITASSALVDAGVRWSALLAATVPLGKSPPTLTDYIELSVGGTLSVGGIGGMASRHGLIVDNVLELEVVTGNGKFVKCSPCKNEDLFYAVLAGLGQFGIIVRARVALVDVAPMVRVYSAAYADIGVFTSDQMMLADDQRFDYVEGFAAPNPGGGWGFALEAATYFDPAAPPDDAAMLSGLSFLPGTVTFEDKPYFDFANRIAETVAFLQSVGAWGVPHPWLDMFVPGPEAASFIGQTLDQTSPASMGQGPILIYPFRRDKTHTPFLRVPDTTHVFLFSLLRFALPPTPENVADLLAQNRAIYDALVEIGGKRYPIGALDVTQADWLDHFGSAFSDFEAAKDEHDPDRVLTPGQKIF